MFRGRDSDPVPGQSAIASLLPPALPCLLRDHAKPFPSFILPPHHPIHSLGIPYGRQQRIPLTVGLIPQTTALHFWLIHELHDSRRHHSIVSASYSICALVYGTAAERAPSYVATF
jgi:hypothetical protein